MNDIGNVVIQPATTRPTTSNDKNARNESETAAQSTSGARKMRTHTSLLLFNLHFYVFSQTFQWILIRFVCFAQTHLDLSSRHTTQAHKCLKFILFRHAIGALFENWHLNFTFWSVAKKPLTHFANYLFLCVLLCHLTGTGVGAGCWCEHKCDGAASLAENVKPPNVY